MIEPHASHLLVTTTADSGRRFAIGRLAGGELVLDDLDADRRLGRVISDADVFYAEAAGRPHVLLAGAVEPAVSTVEVGFADGPQVCRVLENGVWMSWLRPFEAGMRATVIWRDRDGAELRRHQTPPLERRDLEPHPDAGWTGYAPIA